MLDITPPNQDSAFSIYETPSFIYFKIPFITIFIFSIISLNVSPLLNIFSNETLLPSFLTSTISSVCILSLSSITSALDTSSSISSILSTFSSSIGKTSSCSTSSFSTIFSLERTTIASFFDIFSPYPINISMTDSSLSTLGNSLIIPFVLNEI